MRSRCCGAVVSICSARADTHGSRRSRHGSPQTTNKGKETKGTTPGFLPLPAKPRPLPSAVFPRGKSGQPRHICNIVTQITVQECSTPLGGRNGTGFWRAAHRLRLEISGKKGTTPIGPRGRSGVHPLAEPPNRLSLGRGQPPNAADRRVVVRAKRADWSAWGSSEAKDRKPNEVSAPSLPKSESPKPSHNPSNPTKSTTYPQNHPQNLDNPRYTGSSRRECCARWRVKATLTLPNPARLRRNCPLPSSPVTTF